MLGDWVSYLERCACPCVSEAQLVNKMMKKSLKRTLVAALIVFCQVFVGAALARARKNCDSLAPESADQKRGRWRAAMEPRTLA